MIDMGQVTPTTSSQTLVTVPPGPVQVVISNTSGVTVYIGTGTVTATNGFAIPDGAPPVSLAGFPGSAGAKLTVLGGSGSITGQVSWALSTAQ